MSEQPGIECLLPGGPADRWLQETDDVLAVFEFGRSPLDSTDPRHVPVALDQLDTPPLVEVWRCAGPIKTGSWDRLRFAQGEQLTMGHIALDLRETGICAKPANWLTTFCRLTCNSHRTSGR